MGFEERPTKATSHTQWINDDGGNRRKVTVDSAKEPFSDDLISSMARQAEVSVSNFYEVCSKDGAKRAKKGLLKWLLG